MNPHLVEFNLSLAAQRCLSIYLLLLTRSLTSLSKMLGFVSLNPWNQAHPPTFAAAESIYEHLTCRVDGIGIMKESSSACRFMTNPTIESISGGKADELLRIKIDRYLTRPPIL
jgi:hypothetical protein